MGHEALFARRTATRAALQPAPLKLVQQLLPARCRRLHTPQLVSLQHSFIRFDQIRHTPTDYDVYDLME